MGMWAIMMFDLPVKSKRQRRAANQFRKEIQYAGWSRIQLSVYSRYFPGDEVPASVRRQVRGILPWEGEVRMVSVSNRAWSNAMLFRGGKLGKSDGPPGQLTIFGAAELSFEPIDIGSNESSEA